MLFLGCPNNSSWMDGLQEATSHATAYNYSRLVISLNFIFICISRCLTGLFSLPFALHRWVLKSISSRLSFLNNLLLLGKECAPAVPQYISLSPITIGMSQYFTPLSSNKGRLHVLPICYCIGTRVLGDCKSNSPNNPKIAIGTFSNTNY